jgi:hypothetical protein
MRLPLPAVLLIAALLAGCDARPAAQQVVDQDPAALYAKLSDGIDMIQRKVDANRTKLATSKTPVTFSADKTDGKMLHVKIAAVGQSEEMTVWIEPGPVAGQTLLKADLPSRVTRNGGTDLLKQVQSVLTGDYDLINDVLASTDAA